MSTLGLPRVALYLQDKHPIRDGMKHVQYAEARGFETVWQAEARLVRDAIVPMAAYAAATERIQVGSGVINNWTRNAAVIAATFATLDDLAPGRIICGIGAWWEPLATKVGVDRRRPLQAMREVVTVIRKLLAMKRVTFEGDFVRVTDVEIDSVYGERRPKRIPIYIGATGDLMLELAGEIADGVLLNHLVSPAYNRRAMQMIERGAKKGRRSLDLVDRPQVIVCSVDFDRQKALDTSRELVTQYMGQQPRIMRASGVNPDLLDEVHRILTWPATAEQIKSAMQLVPDEVIQMLTASGTPQECRAKVLEYIANGCTCPVLYPLGDDVHLMIDTFSPEQTA